MVTYASEGARTSFLGLPESDQQALKLIHQTEANAIHSAMKLRVSTTLSSSDVIEINGVRMNRGYLKPPTPEEIKALGFHELKDGEKENPERPEYRILAITDLDILKNVFPYLTEDQIRERIPYEVWMLNTKAWDSLFEHRSTPQCRVRRLSNGEIGKIMQYAREKGDDTVMKETESGYVGYHDAFNQRCICVGGWAHSSFGDGSSFAWFHRGSTHASCGSLDPRHLVPAWSVSETIVTETNKV